MTPTKEGFYWAKLVRPTGMPSNETVEDWQMLDFEPVEVFDNNGAPGSGEELMAFVLGRNESQRLDAFEWGEAIPARGSLEADLDAFLHPKRGHFKL